MRVLTLIGAAVVALTFLTTFSTSAGTLASGVVGSGTATAPDETLPTVTIINIGSSDLVDVFFSESGLELFDDDLFDGQVHLAVGELTQIEIEPHLVDRYCMYDAKFVFADGTKQFLWEFDLCETLDIIVSESAVLDMTSVD
jgi:hypothetical protein